MQAHTAAAENWLRLDKNEKTRAAVQAALSARDEKRLAKMFGKRMKFGTAGLRATMDAGTACMNSLTVIQATQGLLAYVKEVKAAQGISTPLKVVVGHDARHNSRDWARHIAAVVNAAGGICCLYSTIVPTPLVPFAVMRYQADVGIMVTASHNPPQDNGYKVYWANGCQIIPPHDAHIEKHIQQQQTPWSEDVWRTDVVFNGTTCVDLEPLKQEYTAGLAKLVSAEVRAANAVAKPLFVYTPVHGVGTEMVLAAFRMCGLPPPAIPESQRQPDPTFPTTAFPNPEEKGVLDEAMKIAEAQGLPIVLGNDPDADRLAVAEKQPGGKWKVFSGNELGALLGYYAYECRGAGVRSSDCVMTASRVSSRFLAAVAKRNGFHFEVTLTGFKWMGNRSRELQAQDKTVLFAFEEAIGYMHGATDIFDKDGVSAAVAAASLAVACYQKGTTLAAYLENLYNTYGWHITNNSYYICHNPAQTAKMFDRLRAWPGEAFAKDGKKYPGSLGPHRIVDVEDVDVGSGSFMITFHFDNSATVTLRTSGTEPKIKYYSELIGKDEASTARELAGLIERVVEEWYEPEKNGFAAPAPPKPAKM